MTRTIGIRIICVAAAVILALASIFGVAKLTTDPAFYQKSIAALEEKQETVFGGDHAAARRHGYADRGQAGGSQRLFSHRALRHFSGKIFTDHHRQCGIQGPDTGGLRRLCSRSTVPPPAADGRGAGVEAGIVRRSNHAGNPGGDPGQ